MRTQVNLYDLQKTYKKEFKTQKKGSRYEGIKECRKNVIKCNLKNKLAYCKGGV